MLPRILGAVLLGAGLTAALHGGTTLDARYNKVAVEPVTTSIYVGYVKLAIPMFTRAGAGYEGNYSAGVFPFFFWSEHGKMVIGISDDDLRRLAHGETVAFKGQAETSDGEARHIEGRAVPQTATQGKLKVRVFVSQKIQLIFNTTYRFVGGP
ncbi:MAG TPA: hypothetical protein VNW23_05350 [Opitutaceae bacterium]|jgi:hypothetical protein|nr:hypothetical protein [Opitutaceae bacterium]